MVRRLGKALGRVVRFDAPFPKGGRDKHLLSLTLLPRDDASHYVWFHLHETAEKHELLLHARLRPRPESSPPKDIQALYEAGGTSELLDELLLSLAKGSIEPFFSVELELRGWARNTPPLVALPLAARTAVLEISGAEYTARPGTGANVHRFRWSQQRQEGRFLVWLDYFERFTSPPRPWHTEPQRCQTLIESLL